MIRATERVRVLYIAGAGRCGSTLFDRILGQYAGVFAAGEVWHVWERSIMAHGRCGCGSTFRSCPVWSAVLHDAFGGFDEKVALTMIERYQRMRTRHLPLAMTSTTWEGLLDRLAPYPENLERLYRSIQRVSQCRLLVDSSKDPLYGLVLGSRSSIDLWVVHLLRDPRATAYSWRRVKPELGYDQVGSMRTAGPVAAATMWSVLNHAAASFGMRHPKRYLALRYEDLVADPRGAIDQIGTLVGEDLGEGPFQSTDNTVTLEPTHSAWGNPDRFQGGAVRVVLDDEWRSAMGTRDRLVATAIASPWLNRFGYASTPRPWRRRPTHPAAMAKAGSPAHSIQDRGPGNGWTESQAPKRS